MTNNAIPEALREAARALMGNFIEQGFRPAGLHAFRDKDGQLLFCRARVKHPDGRKEIRPIAIVGGRAIMKEPAFDAGKPLYALPDIANADESTLVLVVEGENKVDALAERGILATTSGGATSAGGADWSPLRGRRVRVWPDNDDAGLQYADGVAAILSDLGCTVDRINVESLDLPVKGDAVDWLARHPDATAADLLALPLVAIPNAETVAHAGPLAVPTPFRNEVSPPEDQTPATSDQATIARLAALPPMEYDRVRKDEAKALGVQIKTLDSMVSDARQEGESATDVEDIEPWPDPISPSELLNEIASTIRRFIVCAPETAHAAALWAAMTWMMDAVNVAPLAVITAPEKRCGKSQLLFLLGRLCRRPLAASSISPAALFRAVDAWRPTLLVDEADAFMRENEELRGILNAGHTRDAAYVVRVVGDDHKPMKFSVWGAKALAGIGHLADTIMDRSITLELRRKLPHEKVDRLRHAEAGPLEELAAKLARFADDYESEVRTSRPDLPAALNDRAQDNWEPLIAIAEVAGGQWPDLARKAALALSKSDAPTLTTGTELLADIREVFETKAVDRISTADLIKALCDDDEKSWATYNRGKEMTPRQLNKKLADYGVKSLTVRIQYATPKGFYRDQFEEAFARYLENAATAATPPQTMQHKASRVADYPQQDSVADSERVAAVADSGPVADSQFSAATENPLAAVTCGGVADIWGGAGAEEIEVRV